MRRQIFWLGFPLGSLLSVFAGCSPKYNCADLANCEVETGDAGTSSTQPLETVTFAARTSASTDAESASTAEATAASSSSVLSPSASASESLDSTDVAQVTTDAARASTDVVDVSAESSAASTGEPTVCVPDAVECADETQLRRCGADGQWLEAVPCPFVCVGDACTGDCLPDATACNEQGQVVQCSSGGSWEVVQTCAAVCEEGQCLAECSEGSLSCAGKLLRQCEGGVLVDVQTCEFACDDEAGACTGECNPNETQCFDGLLATCGANAQFGVGVECPFVCEGTQCGGECQPDSTRCKSSQMQETCTEQGRWEERGCDFVCNGDRCTGVCIPGARRCLNNGAPASTGSQSQLCGEDGQWGAITACVESCQNTQCTGLCEAGSANECTVVGGEPTLRVCTAGQWVTQTCEFVCSGAQCAGVCEPGSARCDGSGKRQVCSASGQWADQGCSSGSICQGVGACLAKPSIVSLAATGTALQAGRLDGKTGSSVKVGETSTLSWVLSGGAPASITISPSTGAAIDPGATSINVTPTATTDYTITATNAAGTNSKTVTVAVVSGGTRKYIRHFGGAGPDYSFRLAFDPNGKVLTTSYTDGTVSVGAAVANDQPFVTVHTPGTGAVEKLKAISAADATYISSIVRDGAEFVLAGSLNDSQALLRLNANLTVVDTVSYKVGNGANQDTNDLAIDSNRRLLVAGAGSGAGTAVTLSSSFTDRQERSVPGDPLSAGAFDASNNIFLGGTQTLQRYAAALSANPANATLDEGVVITQVAVDHSGAVVVRGYVDVETQGYIAKFTNNLQTLIWSKEINWKVTGLCVDDADNVIIAAGSNVDDFAAFAFSPTGIDLWNSQVLNANGFVYSSQVLCDSAGNVFASGYSGVALPGSSGYSADFDGFLIRFQ